MPKISKVQVTPENMKEVMYRILDAVNSNSDIEAVGIYSLSDDWRFDFLNSIGSVSVMRSLHRGSKRIFVFREEIFIKENYAYEEFEHRVASAVGPDCTVVFEQKGE